MASKADGHSDPEGYSKTDSHTDSRGHTDGYFETDANPRADYYRFAWTDSYTDNEPDDPAPSSNDDVARFQRLRSPPERWRGQLSEYLHRRRQRAPSASIPPTLSRATVSRRTSLPGDSTSNLTPTMVPPRHLAKGSSDLHGHGVRRGSEERDTHEHRHPQECGRIRTGTGVNKTTPAPYPRLLIVPFARFHEALDARGLTLQGSRRMARRLDPEPIAAVFGAIPHPGGG